MAAARDIHTNSSIDVIAIGIGKGVKKEEIEAIASSPNYVLSAENFDKLPDIQKTIVSKTCTGICTLILFLHWVVITNKSQTQAQIQDGWNFVLNSISDSGMVIIKILRLFSYSDLSIKLKNPEIGLYLAQ